MSRNDACVSCLVADSASMPAVVRRLFLYWLPRLLLIRRPMYRLRAGRKPYSRYRPLDEIPGYRIPEATSIIGRRIGSVAAWSSRAKVGRSTVELDAGERRASSTVNDSELHRALEAVNFVAVHLKNDDEYAEVCHLRVVVGVSVQWPTQEVQSLGAHEHLR